MVVCWFACAGARAVPHLFALRYWRLAMDRLMVASRTDHSCCSEGRTGIVLLLVGYHAVCFVLQRFILRGRFSPTSVQRACVCVCVCVCARALQIVSAGCGPSKWALWLDGRLWMWGSGELLFGSR